MVMQHDTAPAVDETTSAVSWGAIVAGAAVSIALTFTLTTLASGFELKLAAPWPGAPPSLEDFSPMLGAAMIVVQVIALGVGGYLAGRLRSKWVNVHTHEVFFRDTAHGFLVWAVSAAIGIGLAATVLAAPVDKAALADMTARDASLAAQASFFLGFGLLLGAFVASSAAALGGLRRDEMHSKVRLGG
jgi:hypothetical protein